jgi:hypothetical protein
LSSRPFLKGWPFLSRRFLSGKGGFPYEKWRLFPHVLAISSAAVSYLAKLVIPTAAISYLAKMAIPIAADSFQTKVAVSSAAVSSLAKMAVS